MRSLVEAAEIADIEIGLIAANKPCVGIEFAAKKNLPFCVVNRADYPDKKAHEEVLVEQIEQANVDWVFLAGYMAILSAQFISRFQSKIINIHPSLLPDLKGLNTHQRAIDAGFTTHGVSIHLVTPELDSGHLITQASLAVQTDDADKLADQVLQIEHVLYPAILLSLASGRLHLDPALSDEAVSWHDTSLLPLAGEQGIIEVKNF